jgi:predicted nucleotidyltransferase
MTLEVASQADIAGDTVEALRRALGERLVAVVLFGSRARGTASRDSDWDLLVIAEGLPERPFDRHLHLMRLLPPACGGVSILAKTPEEFRGNIPSLYLDIGLDGRILYDPDGYAARRLAELKRIIRTAGLYREETEAGDVWRWRREPVSPWEFAWEEWTVQVTKEARYRLKLAEGSLQEARQDRDSRRWRSCVDNSQLAVENAAKGLLALLGPVGPLTALASS